MKRLLICALAVFCLACFLQEVDAHGGSFFSLNLGSRNRSSFRNDAFRDGFRAGQQQQFRNQQFNFHNGNQFRSRQFNQFNGHGSQFRSGFRFSY